MKIKIDYLDKLASEYIRRRSKGYCERCGKYFGWENLQCCHFWGRGRKSIRYDTENLIALDFGCHQYFTAHPAEFVEWFKARLGERDFNLLSARMGVTYPKPDKEAIRLYLTEQIRRLTEGG